MLDDHGELVPPDSFLDVAESHDLIGEVDMWVVSHGLMLLGDLGPDHPDMKVEINLSAASLGDRQLLEHIQRELAASAVDPGHVIFEITETARR